MLEGEFEKVLLVNPQHIKGQAQDGSAGCEVAGIKEQLRRLLTIPGVERMTVWTIPAEVARRRKRLKMCVIWLAGRVYIRATVRVPASA